MRLSTTLARFDRERLAKLTFSIAFIMVLYRALNDALLSQLDAPVLKYPGIDRTYWLLLISNLPQILVGHKALGLAVDVLMVFSCFWCTYFARSRWMAMAFSAAAAIYLIAFNSYAGHHYHGMVGMLLVGIPFWFKSEASFDLAWEGVRYYLLFLFASAAIWKLSRGSVFVSGQMTHILKSQHVDFLVHNPEHWQSGWIRSLISHPEQAQWLLIGVVVLQLSFVSGFFTKRWDWLLFLLSIGFHVGNFLVMRVLSFELLILNVALLPRSSNTAVTSG